MGERRRNLELQTGHRFEIIDYGDGEIGLVGRGEQPSNSTCCDMVLAADGWRSLVEVVTQVIGQWQSIETAPRDGGEVQLWCEGWTSGWYGRSAERWYNVLGFEVEPTHWMPLPAGPEVEDELSAWSENVWHSVEWTEGDDER